MSRHDLYIIESRNPDGSLKLDGPQAHEFFGIQAIKGGTTNSIADSIFRKIPDATLAGTNIPEWPKLINPNWIARLKTW